MMRWPWRSKAARDKESKDALREWLAWESQAESDGFVAWTAAHPSAGAWIECQRREWPTRRVWQSGAEDPYFNVAGLWWRPWRGETIEGSVIDEKAIALDRGE